MKRNLVTSQFVPLAALFVMAQNPNIKPPKESKTFEPTFSDILFYFILPVLLLVVFFLFRRAKRRKHRKRRHPINVFT